VWLGIKLPCKKRAHVRIQFLEEVPEKPGMYTLLAGCETYPDSMVEHTFKEIGFHWRTCGLILA